MKLPGHTSLDQLNDLPREVRQQLRGMWIEGVEEYLALFAAVDPAIVQKTLGTPLAAVEGAQRSATQLLGMPRAAAIMAPRPGGALGCRLDPNLIKMFQAEGVVRTRRSRPARAIRATLPPAARLMDRMPPVKNQGNRGTCVAFSSVAMRECLAGQASDLSEQFLYWACKQIDGTNEPGTFIHTAMNALGTFGVCRGNVWPYEGWQDDSNETHDPPPASAIGEALEFRMLDSRPVEPSYVDQYKQVLAGGDDGPGMPVVFAVLVFNSWYRSSETHRTGKITMPFPGEQPLPYGHAMCVVGYVDDDEVPGGGYFIVRNSWGPDWAPASPEAAGHAMIPYEYVENFVAEAFTGPAGMSMQAAKTSADPMARYVTRLKEPARDMEGKLLRASTPVIASASWPGEFMEDTPANRQRFSELGFEWSPHARASTLLPPQQKLAETFKAQLTDAASSRQRFFAAIDENLRSSVKEIFPDVNLPYRTYLLPWEPRIRDVTEVVDLSEAVGALLRSTAGIPNDVAESEEWKQIWQNAGATKVFCLHVGGGTEAHVVASFITPMKVSREQGPELQSPDATTLEAVRAAYSHWQSGTSHSKPAFTFYTIGSYVAWPENIEPSASGDSWIVCSHPQPDGSWNVHAPPRFADRLSLRNFLDRLHPETRQQRISRIKATVDDLIKSGYEGNINIDKLARQTGYRRSAIEDAMLALQDSRHYRVYRTPEGLLAVTTDLKRPGPRITAASLNPNHFSHFVLVGLILGFAVAAMWLRDVMMKQHVVLSFVLLLPVTYIARVADRRLNRLIESREKD